MAYYLKNKDDINGILDGTDSGPTALPGSFDTGPSGSSTQEGPSAPPAARQQSAQYESPVAGSRPFGGSSLSDIGGSLGRLSASAGDVVKDFQAGAGPEREWGEPMSDTISGAISGTGDLGAAQELVGAEYGGPMGLDQGEVGRMSGGFSDINTAVKPLTQGRGFQLFAQEAAPTMTAGEARFQARRDAPQMQQQAGELSFGARRGLADLEAQSETAADYAQRRMEQEAEIAERARAQVTGSEKNVQKDLAARVGEEEAKAQALDAAWRSFQETGDIRALEGFVDPSVTGQFDFGLQERQKEAQAKHDEIMGDPRYAEIADIGLATLAGEGGRDVGKKGQEKAMIEIDGKEYWMRRLLRGTQRLPGKSKAETIALANLIDERQTMMERFFSPTTGRTQNYLGMSNLQQTGSERAMENLPYFAEQGDRGMYADVLPMYTEVFGGGQMLEPTNLQQYFDYTAGAAPSAENVATEEEAARLNRIYDILGSDVDFMPSERAETGIRAKEGGAGEYNLDELGRWQSATEALQSAEEARRQRVHEQHRKYEASKKSWLKPLSFIPVTAAFTAPFAYGGKGIPRDPYGGFGIEEFEGAPRGAPVAME